LKGTKLFGIPNDGTKVFTLVSLENLLEEKFRVKNMNCSCNMCVHVHPQVGLGYTEK